MTQKVVKNAGSFRDPMGYVYEGHNRIFRVITEAGRKQYEQIPQEVYQQAIKDNFLIPTRLLPKEEWPLQDGHTAYMLEHDAIPYISYPYEWSFYQLKEAALHHLDFQRYLLKSAYNIQFIGSRPIFIDLLSLAPYQPGEYWIGHHQFCMQFLNPLILRSILGIKHNDWFRGSLEGVPTAEIALMLPTRKKFSWNILTHILLQNKLDKSAQRKEDQAIVKAKKQSAYSKLAYDGLLRQMRNWIAGLEPKKTQSTYWGDYAQTNTYETDEASKKKAFVADFSSHVAPQVLVDLGCNSGDYSLLSIESGAGYVVGFDFDQSAIEAAYHRAKSNAKPFLPLYLNAANPSPDQGWMQAERFGFTKRTKADAVIALAFIHHLAIAKNVPLSQLVEWLVEIAPQGVIEFIPKNDPTVKKMLSLREDIFSDYSQDNFEHILQEKAKIVKKATVSKCGRCLYWFKRL